MIKLFLRLAERDSWLSFFSATSSVLVSPNPEAKCWKLLTGLQCSFRETEIFVDLRFGRKLGSWIYFHDSKVRLSDGAKESADLMKWMDDKYYWGVRREDAET